MDFEQHQAASSSSSQIQTSSSSPNVNVNHPERALRSSSRLKAAKEKEVGNPEQAPPVSAQLYLFLWFMAC